MSAASNAKANLSIKTVLILIPTNQFSVKCQYSSYLCLFLLPFLFLVAVILLLALLKDLVLTALLYRNANDCSVSLLPKLIKYCYSFLF